MKSFASLLAFMLAAGSAEAADAPSSVQDWTPVPQASRTRATPTAVSKNHQQSSRANKIAAAVPTAAEGAPFAPAHLEYAVLRDGSPVGRHVVDIARRGNRTDVSINTNVAVSIAFITVYRFEHAGHEQWSGHRLIGLRSKTNDNGTYHQLAVAVVGDHLQVGADGTTSDAPQAILPASLWNEGIVAQTTLLNTLDGRQMRVNVRDAGEEAVRAKGVKTPAHHYRMSGGLNRELWFDSSNTLVRVAFAADDGSHIVYELQ